MQESIFSACIQCRCKERSRSLSHLLMSFLFKLLSPIMTFFSRLHDIGVSSTVTDLVLSVFRLLVCRSRVRLSSVCL